MARRKKLVQLIIGVAIGLVLASVFKKSGRNDNIVRCKPQPSPLKKSYAPKPDVFAKNFDQNLLFVGVMTASKYLDTRAKAVYQTWGKNVPGKIQFFSSEQSHSETLPLVSLSGIDDSYPPQKKSFEMLKYMHDNYIDQYDWFLRADDDVYIRTDRLEKLLRSVDSRMPWFIGQTGRGNQEEFGLLSLEKNENFCMGGPGIIFSRETLKRMAPHIDECLGNLKTTHEDVELGRCVRKFAGVPCTWSYEMQVILYHNQSGEAAFTGDLKQKEVHHAITMHPIKHPEHMYRLHNYVKGLKIQDLQHESVKLHRDIAASMQHFGVKLDQLANAELVDDLPLFPEPIDSPEYLGDPELLGAPLGLNRLQPRTLEDVIDWELISKSLYSYKDSNPKRRIGTSMKEGLSDVIRELMEIINDYSKQRGRIIDFKEILYGYWRLDPLHGVDLILDLSLVYKKYRGHKMTVPVRRHAYIQQTFTGLQIREVSIDNSDNNALNLQAKEERPPTPQQILNNVILQIEANLPKLPVLFSPKNDSHEKYINFILPLSGRYETFQRFIEVYEDNCIRERELTRLIIVLYRNEKAPDDFIKTQNLISAMREKYASSEIILQTSNETFTRGRALHHGTELMQSDDLLLFIDVDIVFDKKSLLRMRHNTVQNKSIYFPIVFSLYNPQLSQNSSSFTTIDFESIINHRSGFWRQFGFGIVSLYKSDFESLRGFNISITGWGLEDVAFFDNVVKSHLKIFRSADPGLVHVYHPVHCDSNLEKAQKNMCLGTQANTYASLYDLQKYILNNKHLLT